MFYVRLCPCGLHPGAYQISAIFTLRRYAGEDMDVFYEEVGEVVAIVWALGVELGKALLTMYGIYANVRCQLQKVWSAFIQNPTK